MLWSGLALLIMNTRNQAFRPGIASDCNTHSMDMSIIDERWLYLDGYQPLIGCKHVKV